MFNIHFVYVHISYWDYCEVIIVLWDEDFYISVINITNLFNL